MTPQEMIGFVGMINILIVAVIIWWVSKKFDLGG